MVSSQPQPTAAPASVTISYSLPTADLSTQAITFASSQPQGTASAELPLTVTNNGSANLIVSGVQMGGTDPGDYLIDNGCQEQVKPGASCRIGLRFAPQNQGPSTATMTLLSNAPSADGPVQLSGNGGPPAQGTQGPQGVPGPQGPQGPRGPAGQVICRNGALILCSIEFVPGTWTAQSSAATDAFRIVRHGRTVARGTLAVRRGHVTRQRLPRLARGTYTLTISVGRGHGSKTLWMDRFTVR